MEEWREIPGTEYEVSSEGRIGRWKKGRWWVLNPSPGGGGYLTVKLRGSGDGKTRHVHRLVAEAFLGPKPTPKHEVNHIDGVKTNNRAANFEWVTRKENVRHRYDVLKHYWGRKITESDVREMRTRCAAGELQKVVAADLGVRPSMVSMIVGRKRWSWVA